jgi:hypothetical protein
MQECKIQVAESNRDDRETTAAGMLPLHKPCTNTSQLCMSYGTVLNQIAAWPAGVPVCCCWSPVLRRWLAAAPPSWARSLCSTGPAAPALHHLACMRACASALPVGRLPGCCSWGCSSSSRMSGGSWFHSGPQLSSKASRVPPLYHTPRSGAPSPCRRPATRQSQQQPNKVSSTRQKEHHSQHLDML